MLLQLLGASDDVDAPVANDVVSFVAVGVAAAGAAPVAGAVVFEAVCDCV